MDLGEAIDEMKLFFLGTKQDYVAQEFIGICQKGTYKNLNDFTELYGEFFYDNVRFYIFYDHFKSLRIALTHNNRDLIRFMFRHLYYIVDWFEYYEEDIKIEHHNARRMIKIILEFDDASLIDNFEAWSEIILMERNGLSIEKLLETSKDDIKSYDTLKKLLIHFCVTNEKNEKLYRVYTTLKALDPLFDINKIAHCQEPLIHYAARNNNTDTMRFLLQQKICPNTHNQFGQTPLEIAFNNNHKETIYILIAHPETNLKSFPQCADYEKARNLLALRIKNGQQQLGYDIATTILSFVSHHDIKSNRSCTIM